MRKTWRVWTVDWISEFYYRREIVAATSRTAAARLLHARPSRVTETRNEEEFAAAATFPGVVFWAPIDRSSGVHFHTAGGGLTKEQSEAFASVSRCRTRIWQLREGK